MKTGAVLLSGGLDSSTLLAFVISQKSEMGLDRILAVSADYGQRHRRELDHASQIAEFYEVQFQLVDLTSVGRLLVGHSYYGEGGGSSLLGLAPVPAGHYAEETMKDTIVPNRNMMMISIAAGLVEAAGGGVVFTAVHAGDHFIYPDCRPQFTLPVTKAVEAATEGRTTVKTPFVTMTKKEIVDLGNRLGVPYALTYSCYRGGPRHCGSCGTCVERHEAFLLAGVTDPTEYVPGGVEYAESILADKK